MAAFNLAGPIAVVNSSSSGSNGPICCCGCGSVVKNQAHICQMCKGRVFAGFCFVGDGEAGINGICHACAKGGGARASSVPKSTLESSSKDGSRASTGRRWTGNSERVNGMKRKNVSEDFSSPPAKKKSRQSTSSGSAKKGAVSKGSQKASSELYIFNNLRNVIIIIVWAGADSVAGDVANDVPDKEFDSPAGSSSAKVSPAGEML